MELWVALDLLSAQVLVDFIEAPKIRLTGRLQRGWSLTDPHGQSLNAIPWEIVLIRRDRSASEDHLGAAHYVAPVSDGEVSFDAFFALELALPQLQFDYAVQLLSTPRSDRELRFSMLGLDYSDHSSDRVWDIEGMAILSVTGASLNSGLYQTTPPPLPDA